MLKHLLILSLVMPALVLAKKEVISRITETPDGRPYLEVEGKPMVYNAVQAWKAPAPEFLMEGGYCDNMDKAHEVGYRIFTFWLTWRDLEPKLGRYDWSSIDAMIERAEALDMRLDIVWGGSNFCSHLDPRFAPDWLLDWDAVHLKDSEGGFVKAHSGDFGKTRAVDHANPTILKKEQEMVRALIEHIARKDKTHRVVFFQVLNEPNMREWTHQDKGQVLRYINELASVVKASDYKIATRTNLSGKVLEPDIELLEHVDCHGPDPYTEDINLIRSLILEPTKFPHIAENAAYKNTTSMMVTTFANGGGYNIYMLGPDLVWEKPGVYDLNWEPWEVTYGVYNLNTAVNNIGGLLAVASRENMIDFNTEEDYPDPNYNAMKTLAGREIGFETWSRRGEGNSAVGMAVHKDGEFYLIADRITWFRFKDEPASVSSGYFDSEGEWVESNRKYWHPRKDGFEVPYHAGECLRVRLK